MRKIVAKIIICIKKKYKYFGIMFCKVAKSIYICINKQGINQFSALNATIGYSEVGINTALSTTG